MVEIKKKNEVTPKELKSLFNEYGLSIVEEGKKRKIEVLKDKNFKKSFPWSSKDYGYKENKDRLYLWYNSTDIEK